MVSECVLMDVWQITVVHEQEGMDFNYLHENYAFASIIVCEDSWLVKTSKNA